jgi:diaminopimelate decarboxylase
LKKTDASEGSEGLILKESLSIGKNNHLLLRGIDLVELGNEYGTPLFVFDERTLADTFENFRRAFESIYPRMMVCYSIKTNSNLAVCRILGERGAFAEVSSELDLQVALRAGFSGDRIIFDGPFKPEEALRRALREKILLINVESFSEMERLDRIAGEMGIKQPVGIRVNTFKKSSLFDHANLVNLISAAYCNLDSRFGFSLEDAYLAFERAKRFQNLSIEGVMTHPYRAATRVLLPMMREIHERFGIEMRYLDIGGGFDPGTTRFVGTTDFVYDFLRRKIGLKSKLREEKAATNVESTAKRLIGQIKEGLEGLSKPIIIVEPGRFLTSGAGILLLRVDHVKDAGGYRWAMVDGGTNIIPRFNFIELRKIVVANKASNAPEEQVNIVGPLLYNEDFISLKTELPKISEGDTLSVFDCGAYTLSRANQFLHARPPAVLLSSNGEVKVIREKETFEDFSRKDILS